MRGLSFIVSGELYTVDVTRVQKVARKLAITPVPSAPDEIIGVANLKGRVVTVLSLDKLLDSDKQSDLGRYVNTIIFKSSSSTEDQMGIAVEKPGDLIDIDQEAVKPTPATSGTDGSLCISGVTEIADKFYRIIDIEYIRSRYMSGNDTGAVKSSFGGAESD